MAISPFPCWKGNQSTTAQLKTLWDQRRVVREDVEAGREEGALQVPSVHGHSTCLAILRQVTKRQR